MFRTCTPRHEETSALLAEAITARRYFKAAYRTRSHLMAVAPLFAAILEVTRQATTLFFSCQNH